MALLGDIYFILKEPDQIKKNFKFLEKTLKSSFYFLFAYTKKLGISADTAEGVVYLYLSIIILYYFNSRSNLIPVLKNDASTSSFNAISEIFIYLFNLQIMYMDRLELADKITINKYDSYKLIVIILNKLVSHEILGKKTIRVGAKTPSYFYFKNFTYILIADYSTKPVRMITFDNRLYNLGSTFFNIRAVLTPNVHSNEVLGIDPKKLQKQINTPISIDGGTLCAIFKEFNQRNLRVDGCRAVIEESVLEERRSLHYKLSLALEAGLTKTIVEIQKKSSIIDKYIKFLKVINLVLKSRTNVFYLQSQYDFRGRAYYNTILSITNFKELRYCAYLGKYRGDPLDSYKNSKTYKIYTKWVPFLKNLLPDFNINDSEYYHIITLLLCIGEMYKSSLGTSITMSEFLEKAVDVYYNSSREMVNLPYEKSYALRYYVKIIDLIKVDHPDKHLRWKISKDATASVIQLLVQILGFQDRNILKLANMDSTDTWFDPYSWIIVHFFKYRKKEYTKEYSDFFNRTLLKKVIMTIYYSSTYNTCYTYWSNEISLDEALNKRYALDKDLLDKLFKDFYNFIKTDGNLFQHELPYIQDNITNNTIFFTDNTSVSLEYYKMESKRVDIETYHPILKKNIRSTKSFKKINYNKLDNKKIKASINPNVIHAHDALVIRLLKETFPNLLTIHDCYLIDYRSSIILIEKLNEIYNDQFSKNKNLNQKVLLNKGVPLYGLHIVL